MSDLLHVGLAVVLMVAGMAALLRAGYLQYAALPEEHTFATSGARAALALVGVALVFGGSRLLS